MSGGDDSSSLLLLTLRLQFPDGHSEQITVSPSSTIQHLLDTHVSSHVEAGLVGQLIYLGRPLRPLDSTLSSHGVTNDTVIQVKHLVNKLLTNLKRKKLVFVRRPHTTPDPDRPEVQTNYDQQITGLSRTLSSIGAFALVSSWLYFVFSADDEEVDEDEEGNYLQDDLLPFLCLVFLSVIFVALAGPRRMF